MKLTKIISLMLIFSAMLLALVSCTGGGDDGAPSGYQLASEAALDYKLYIPNDWTVDSDSGVSGGYVTANRTNVTLMAFDLSDSKIQITSGVTAEQQLTEYWTGKDGSGGYENDFKNTFGDFTYVVNGENTTLSSCPAKKYVYTATVTGLKCKYMQITAIKDGTVYLFTYTAGEENYDTYLEQVEGIISNIVI